MSATAPKVRALAAVGLTALAACSHPGSGSQRLGQAIVSLALAPTDVGCVVIQVVGTSTVTSPFDVAPQGSTVFALNDLPLGSDTFTAVAYPTSCALASGATPTWISNSPTVFVVAGAVSQVTLGMSQDAGEGIVSVDFPLQRALAPVGVDCIVVEAMATGTVTFPFDVAPESSTVFSLFGVPLGTETFTAQAFAAPCAQTSGASATWASAGVMTSVTEGAPASVSLVMVALDAGSSDAGADAGSGADAGNGTDAGQVGRFLYSSSTSGSRITLHSIDAATGQLRFDGYTLVNPSGPGDTLSHPVLTPSGQFLYAGDVTTGDVYGFSISPDDGQLTSLGFAQPVSAFTLAAVTAVSSQETFLYAFSAGTLQVATVNVATGALSNLIASTPPGSVVSKMVFDPQGAFAYFGLNTGIAGYSLDASTGALTVLSGSPFSAGQQGSFNLIIAVSGSGFLYAANANERMVHSFAIASTGALTEVGTAQATGNLPGAVAVDPLSQYVFISDGVTSTVTPYVIQANGSLSPQAPVATGPSPGVLAVDPSSAFLYVTAQTGSSFQYTGVQTFSIGANGALTAAQTVGEANIGSVAILGGSSGVTHVPQFVFVASEGFGDVTAYLVDPSSGALTVAPNSPVSTMGGQPSSIATDLLGRFVYAPSFSGNPALFPAFTVTDTGVNAGDLTPVAGMPNTGADSQGIVVEPSSRFAYVTNTSNNAVSEYALDSTTGLLTPLPGSPFIVPNGGNGAPLAIACSPFGATLFVTNRNADTVSALAISAQAQDAGTLTNFSGSPLSTGDAGAQGPVAVAVDPSNRFVYVANESGQSIAAYQFNDANAFAPIAGPGFVFGTSDAGSGPTSLAIEPTGRFLYATLGPASFGMQVAGVVVGYQIDPSTGALSEVNVPVTVNGTSSMGGSILQGAAVDPSGQFLYAVVNNDSASPTNGTVVLLQIDSQTGALTLSPTTFSAPYGPAALTVSGVLH
jgi:6-phosphogluconolactonase